MLSRVHAFLFMVLVSLFSGVAFAGDGGGAATLDVSGATGFLSGDVTAAIVAVGGALILLAALALGFKWIKAMFFN